jgi:hypothetical protein
MTVLSAYIQISKDRYIDTIAMFIHDVLFKPMEQVRDLEAFKFIDDIDDEKLEDILSETSNMQNERKKLNHNVKVLKKAQPELDNFY